MRDAAARFAPDVVLIAGDFIDDVWVLEDPELRSDAARFLASLPSAGGRFMVPGEMEAGALGTVRASLEPETAVLVNASRRIVVGDRCLELFGSLEPGDPPPWSTGEDRGRPFVTSRHAPGRSPHWLRHEGAAEAAPREITLAFQSATDHARIAIDLGGRVIERHEGRPDFKARGVLRGRAVSGFTPRQGVWYRARIEARVDEGGTHLRARFWDEGAAEPSEWTIDALDPGDLEGPRGSVALGGLWGEARYADVEVRDGRGETLLRESFEPGWLAHWDSGSALERWLLGTSESPCERVVLSHSPDVIRQVRDSAAPRPCIVLAGHTHGGQVRLPGVGALYSSTWIGRRFDRGLFDFGGVPLYITAGVGTTILPIRLFDPPEVTLLTLGP